MDLDPTNNQTQQLYMDLDQALEVDLAGLKGLFTGSTS